MRGACTTPDLPVVGCVLPAAGGPTPSAAPTPAPSPTPTPTSAPAPRTVHPAALPAAGSGPLPVPTAAPVAPAVVAPGLPAAATGAPAATTPAPVAATAAPAVAGVPVVAAPAAGVPLTTAVASAYGIVVFGVVALALLVSFLAGLRPAPAPSAPAAGGTVRTQRTRLWAGLAVIAAAAVVGGIGWYRISGEPLLNRQIPFLASAGIAVVVLAVLGGALVVAEQLRSDQHRLGELESAVRALTERLSPLVEQPARRTDSDALLQ
jgi:hypothetical protein